MVPIDQVEGSNARVLPLTLVIALLRWRYSIVRRLFRLWRVGGQDLRILLAALRDRDRPQWLLPASLLLVFFAIEPLNIAFPALGIVDDFVLLPLLLRALVRLSAPSIRARRDERVVSVQ